MVRQMYPEEYASLDTLREIRWMCRYWYDYAERRGASYQCGEYLEGWSVVSQLVIALR